MSKLIHHHREQAPSHSGFRRGLFLQQGGARGLEGLMLILVQRRRQFKGVLLVLRIDGLRRQQRHLNPLQQLKHPFNLERGRATGEFAFFAAFL